MSVSQTIATTQMRIQNPNLITHVNNNTEKSPQKNVKVISLNGYSKTELMDGNLSSSSDVFQIPSHGTRSSPFPPTHNLSDLGIPDQRELHIMPESNISNVKGHENDTQTSSSQKELINKLSTSSFIRNKCAIRINCTNASKIKRPSSLLQIDSDTRQKICFNIKEKVARASKLYLENAEDEHRENNSTEETSKLSKLAELKKELEIEKVCNAEYKKNLTSGIWRRPRGFLKRKRKYKKGKDKKCMPRTRVISCEYDSGSSSCSSEETTNVPHTTHKDVCKNKENRDISQEFDDKENVSSRYEVKKSSCEEQNKNSAEGQDRCTGVGQNKVVEKDKHTTTGEKEVIVLSDLDNDENYLDIYASNKKDIETRNKHANNQQIKSSITVREVKGRKASLKALLLGDGGEKDQQMTTDNQQNSQDSELIKQNFGQQESVVKQSNSHDVEEVQILNSSTKDHAKHKSSKVSLTVSNGEAQGKTGEKIYNDYYNTCIDLWSDIQENKSKAIVSAPSKTKDNPSKSQPESNIYSSSCSHKKCSHSHKTCSCPHKKVSSPLQAHSHSHSHSGCSCSGSHRAHSYSLSHSVQSCSPRAHSPSPGARSPSPRACSFTHAYRLHSCSPSQSACFCFLSERESRSPARNANPNSISVSKSRMLSKKVFRPRSSKRFSSLSNTSDLDCHGTRLSKSRCMEKGSETHSNVYRCKTKDRRLNSEYSDEGSLTSNIINRPFEEVQNIKEHCASLSLTLDPVQKSVLVKEISSIQEFFKSRQSKDIEKMIIDYFNIEIKEQVSTNTVRPGMIEEADPLLTNSEKTLVSVEKRPSLPSSVTIAQEGETQATQEHVHCQNNLGKNDEEINYIEENDQDIPIKNEYSNKMIIHIISSSDDEAKNKKRKRETGRYKSVQDVNFGEPANSFRDDAVASKRTRSKFEAQRMDSNQQTINELMKEDTPKKRYKSHHRKKRNETNMSSSKDKSLDSKNMWICGFTDEVTRNISRGRNYSTETERVNSGQQTTCVSEEEDIPQSTHPRIKCKRKHKHHRKHCSLRAKAEDANENCIDNSTIEGRKANKRSHKLAKRERKSSRKRLRNMPEEGDITQSRPQSIKHKRKHKTSKSHRSSRDESENPDEIWAESLLGDRKIFLFRDRKKESGKRRMKNRSSKQTEREWVNSSQQTTNTSEEENIPKSRHKRKHKRHRRHRSSSTDEADNSVVTWIEKFTVEDAGQANKERGKPRASENRHLVTNITEEEVVPRKRHSSTKHKHKHKRKKKLGGSSGNKLTGSGEIINQWKKSSSRFGNKVIENYQGCLRDDTYRAPMTNSSPPDTLDVYTCALPPSKYQEYESKQTEHNHRPKTVSSDLFVLEGQTSDSACISTCVKVICEELNSYPSSVQIVENGCYDNFYAGSPHKTALNTSKYLPTWETQTKVLQSRAGKHIPANRQGNNKENTTCKSNIGEVVFDSVRNPRNTSVHEPDISNESENVSLGKYNHISSGINMSKRREKSFAQLYSNIIKNMPPGGDYHVCTIGYPGIPWISAGKSCEKCLLGQEKPRAQWNDLDSCTDSESYHDVNFNHLTTFHQSRMQGEDKSYKKKFLDNHKTNDTDKSKLINNSDNSLKYNNHTHKVSSRESFDMNGNVRLQINSENSIGDQQINKNTCNTFDTGAGKILNDIMTSPIDSEDSLSSISDYNSFCNEKNHELKTKKCSKMQERLSVNNPASFAYSPDKTSHSVHEGLSVLNNKVRAHSDNSREYNNPMHKVSSRESFDTNGNVRLQINSENAVGDHQINKNICYTFDTGAGKILNDIMTSPIDSEDSLSSISDYNSFCKEKNHELKATKCSKMQERLSVNNPSDNSLEYNNPMHKVSSRESFDTNGNVRLQINSENAVGDHQINKNICYTFDTGAGKILNDIMTSPIDSEDSLSSISDYNSFCNEKNHELKTKKCSKMQERLSVNNPASFAYSPDKTSHSVHEGLSVFNNKETDNLPASAYISRELSQTFENSKRLNDDNSQEASFSLGKLANKAAAEVDNSVYDSAGSSSLFDLKDDTDCSNSNTSSLQHDSRFLGKQKTSISYLPPETQTVPSEDDCHNRENKAVSIFTSRSKTSPCRKERLEEEKGDSLCFLQERDQVCMSALGNNNSTNNIVTSAISSNCSELKSTNNMGCTTVVTTTNNSSNKDNIITTSASNTVIASTNNISNKRITPTNSARIVTSGTKKAEHLIQDIDIAKKSAAEKTVDQSICESPATAFLKPLSTESGLNISISELAPNLHQLHQSDTSQNSSSESENIPLAQRARKRLHNSNTSCHLHQVSNACTSPCKPITEVLPEALQPTKLYINCIANICPACSHDLIPDWFTSVNLSTGSITMKCQHCLQYIVMKQVLEPEFQNKAENMVSKGYSKRHKGKKAGKLQSACKDIRNSEMNKTESSKKKGNRGAKNIMINKHTVLASQRPSKGFKCVQKSRRHEEISCKAPEDFNKTLAMTNITENTSQGNAKNNFTQVNIYQKKLCTNKPKHTSLKFKRRQIPGRTASKNVNSDDEIPLALRQTRFFTKKPLVILTPVEDSRTSLPKTSVKKRSSVVSKKKCCAVMSSLDQSSVEYERSKTSGGSRAVE
nr:uncharacterized protein LOC123756872 isoform X1 [Procambarus clarkii]